MANGLNIVIFRDTSNKNRKYYHKQQNRNANSESLEELTKTLALHKNVANISQY